MESIFLNHDLGRFHHGSHDVTLLELQFVGAPTGDGAFDQVVSYSNHHMTHNVAQLDFLNGSGQFVSG